MPQNNNNPITEVALAVLAALFIAGGVFLLYVGKIDVAGASLMFGFPAALFGINQALKAPSPAQQQQLAAQHQDLQLLASQVVSVLPSLLAAQQPPVQASQPAPQVVQQPFPPSSTFPLPVIPK